MLLVAVAEREVSAQTEMVLLREQVAMAALVQLVLLPGLQLIMLVAVVAVPMVALLPATVV
jgi:hypothetical protein